MVVQRQNPAYRLAPPTRRLMRRIPGVPNITSVLKQLRKEKRPRSGPFLFSAELRADVMFGALRGFQPAGKHLSVPMSKRSRKRRLAGCGRAGQTLGAGPHLGPCAAFSLLENTHLSPRQKRVRGAGWLGVGTQVRHCARAQHLGPCAAFSLLGARRGT